MLLLFNAIAHFCVDGLCASVLFGRLPESAMALVTVYNALAFATQCLIGIIADRWKEQRWAEGLSIIAIVLGWYLPVSPLARVLLIGLGNSVFHVTGGIMTMKRSAGRALELGVFVAPGALGLSIGVLWQSYGDVFAVLLLLCGIFAFVLEKKTQEDQFYLKNEDPDWTVLILLTVAVAVRAIGGTAVHFSWKTGAALSLCMTLFVVAGKMLGGLFCDRLGPLKTAVISIIPASILIAFFSDLAIPSMVGQLAVNLTMPVTLWLMYRCIPDSPGLAFGLAASALLPGTLAGHLMTLTGPALWICVLISFLFGLVAIIFSYKRMGFLQDPNQHNMEGRI